MKFRVAGVTLVLVMCALMVPTTAGAFTSVAAFRANLQKRINHFRGEYGRAPIHLNLHLNQSWSEGAKSLSYAQLSTTRNKREDVGHRGR